MTATELLQAVQNLPEFERRSFDAQYQGGKKAEALAAIQGGKRTAMPNFMERMRQDFPNGIPPGTPCSEIIDEGRGES